MGLQANSSWTTYFDVPTGPLLLHLTKSLVEKTWRTDPSVLTLWRLHRADVLTLLLISSLSAHGVATGGAWRRTSNDSLAFYCKPKLSFSSKLDRDKYHTRVSSLLSLREFLCLFLFCFVSLLVGPFIFRFKLLIFLWTLRQYKKKWFCNARWACLKDHNGLDLPLWQISFNGTPFMALCQGLYYASLLLGSCRFCHLTKLKHLSRPCTFLCWCNAACPL